MEDSLSPEYWSPPALTLLSESLATSLTLWVSAPPPPTLGLCLLLSLGSVSVPLWVPVLPFLWVFITLFGFHSDVFCPHT